MKRKLLFVVLMAMVLLAVSNLSAQVNATGTLLGTVMDKSGAVVPGADVKATNKETGVVRETKSGEAGQYRFDLLPIGTYEVRVTMKGFSTAVFGNVPLAVSQTTTIDPKLDPSAQAEVITVEATGAALVDVQKTDVSVPITTKEIQDLPL